MAKKKERKKERRGNNEGSITKRADGRWQVAVLIGYDEKGKPRRKYFYSKDREEVAQKMNQALNQVYSGSFLDPAKITLEEWLQAWLKGRKPYLAESSYMKHEVIMRRHIIPELGGAKLKNVTTRGIQTLLNDKLEKGRVKKKKTDPESGLSPETVRAIHRTLNAALNQAVKEKKIAHNPAEHVELPRLEPKEMRTFTAEELQRFFQAAQDSYYFAAFYLDLATGLRRGELLGLRWKDIDLERGTVSVWQQLVKSSEQPRLKLKALTKTPKSKRTIAIDADAVQVLKEHLSRQTEIKTMLLTGGIDYLDHGLVFCMDDGRPIDPDNFYRRFNSLLKKAGIPKGRVHDLRHTYATIALEEGVNIKALQETLGHATIKMTGDIYGHVTTRMKEEAANKVGGILSKLASREQKEVSESE